MRVIYMGKDKISVINGLRYLLEKGVQVTCVVADKKKKGNKISLANYARKEKIPVKDAEDLYKIIRNKKINNNPNSFLFNIDLVVSFLYWKKIEGCLINLPKIGCINFHPAPLPEYRGVAGYSFAILNDCRNWGVSAHFVDEKYDTGDLIRVKRFKIDPEKETAYSLENKTQERLSKLFEEIISLALINKKLPRKKQNHGCYYSMKDFEKLRKILSSDRKNTVDKKIRAFWFPPLNGAYIKIDEEEYTLVNKYILEKCFSR